MIIRVYDGEFDAAKFSSITPVIDHKTEEGKDAFIIQIVCDGVRSTLWYETKENAEKERDFMLTFWMKSKGQEAINIMAEEKTDADKVTTKEEA